MKTSLSKIKNTERVDDDPEEVYAALVAVLLTESLSTALTLTLQFSESTALQQSTIAGIPIS